MKNKKENINCCMVYSFESSLDNDISNLEHTAFINNYKVDIYERDENGFIDNELKIGSIEFDVILNCSAINDSYPIEELYDGEEYVNRLFQQIYDYDDVDGYRLNKFITNFYGLDEFNNVDSILFLKNIQIIESHRNIGIGNLAINDIIRRFPTVNLIATHPFPLQFQLDLDTKENNSEWGKKINLDSLSNNKVESTKKLIKFYSKLGFKRIYGLVDDLMIKHQDYY